MSHRAHPIKTRFVIAYIARVNTMTVSIKKFNVFLSGALLACIFVGCTKTHSADEYLQEAKAFRAKHEYKSAIIQLKNLLSTDPHHAEARLLLGILFKDTKDLTAAEVELRRARQLDPQSIRVTVALTRALLDQGKYEQALNELEAFDKKNPSPTPELLTLQGNARFGLKRQNARSSYLAALQKDPAFTDAQLAVARLDASEGKVDQALRQIALTLEQSPAKTEAWLLRGDLFRSKLVADEAEKSYRKAVEIDPAQVQAHLMLADLYLSMARLDAARAEMNAVRAVEPQNLMLLYQQAALHLLERKYGEAREAIQQVRKQAPEHMPSMLVSGAAAYFTASTEQADRELTLYLGRFPDDVYARKLLAANALRGNQPDKALETIAPLLAAGKDSQAFAIAGEAALKASQFGKASEYLRKAATLAPQNAAVRTRLGVSRLLAGDGEAGIADLESASALTTDSSRTDLILVLVHLNRNEYDKALAVASALEKKQPKDPSVFNLKAHALLAQGNTALARKNLETALALQPDYFPAANSLAVLDVRDKNFDAARKRFHVALQKEGTQVAAMLALADVAVAAGNPQERLKWLEKAAETAPAALRPRLLLTRHHLAAKDFRKALAAARQAQTANPDSTEALALLGATQIAAGEKDDAVVTYHKLVRVTPESPAAHHALALAQINARGQEGARSSLEKALQLQPNYADAEIALAALEVQAGHYPEALKRAQRLRSRMPKSAAGATLEGDLRMSQKDFLGAARAYDAALELSKTSGLFVKAHQALVRGARAHEAEAKASAWLKQHPADNAARQYLATTAMQAGQNQAAISQYQAVLQREPDNAVALNNVAWLYQLANDPRALPTADRAARLMPDDATVCDTLGWILLQQGNTARGIEVLQRAVALSPKSAALRYHLAVGYDKAGDKTRAREALDAALAASEPFRERQDAIALRAQL